MGFMAIVVFGSINMDLTTYVPHLPRPGETLRGESFITVPGGKGANQAVAAARLGGTVSLVGRVGADDFGRDHLRTMEGEGVDTSGVLVDQDHSTGLAVISVDSLGENAIIVISGANMAIEARDVHRCEPLLEGASVLLLQLEVPLPAVFAALRAARERGVRTVLDPAPATPLPEEIFPLIDVITPNEIEVDPLVGFPATEEGAPARAAERLRALGVGSAVIKLGGRGAFLDGEGAQTLVPAFPVNPIDTVAAGDAFNGALAVALDEGLRLKQAVVWGAAAGALATTRQGALPSLPHREDLERMLNEGAGP
jgi:ribokinase